MDKLRAQHRAVIIAIFGLCAAASISMNSLIALLPFRVTPEVVQVAIQATPLAGGSLLAVYEWFGWRLINPSLDFAGPWVFHEKQYAIDEAGNRTFSFDAWGTIRIKQSVRRIAVIEASTRQGVLPASIDHKDAELDSSWSSRACDLTDDGDTLYLCLEHESAGARKGGPIRYGVEVIKVDDEVTWRGAPKAMNSVVYHCVGGGAPKIVDCRYERGSLRTFYARRKRRPRRSGEAR